LFEGRISDEIIQISGVADIWIRDFGTVDTMTEVKFDYKPRYLENEDTDGLVISIEIGLIQRISSVKNLI